MGCKGLFKNPSNQGLTVTQLISTVQRTIIFGVRKDRTILFSSARERKPRASSDRFCPCPCPCLSLSQKLVQFG